MTNQTEFIAKYNQENRIKLNPDLFARSNDDIIRELKNVILSCQRENKYFTIKVESFRVVEDYDEINRILYKYYSNAMRNKKKDNQYAYMNLKDSDVQLLVVKYFTKIKDEQDHLTVFIEVPRIVDKYYFRIGGGLYSALYQIVDGSTYNNATSNAKNPSVTIKIIFMATRMYRYFNEMKTTENETLKATHYVSRIFNKSVSVTKYFLAKFGYYGTINFLGIQDVYITEEDPKNNNLYAIPTNTETPYFICVPKYLFDRDLITQSFVSCLYRSIIDDVPYQEIFNHDFWVRSLGGEFNNSNKKKKDNPELNNDTSTADIIHKGYSILDSFESIYDISTKNSIRLPEDQKADMYCILRWMMREFNQLRLKDNLDVGIKKIRCAEYIASLYAMKIAKGIYRVADLNRRATLNSIVKAINVAPNYLLRAMSKCKLVNYRNMVNDMDSLSALKFTYKGISGLGEASSNSIPNIYRTVQVSHIGRIDLDSSSASDPGVTGTISPFAKIYDGFFTDYKEPNFWQNEFVETVNEYLNTNKLTEVFEFRKNVLGQDVHEEIEVAGEVKALMQQLINPAMIMDEEDQKTIIDGSEIFGC